MYRVRQVRKETYERCDVFDEPEEPGGATEPGLESLQELNERFARYISRARALEQRNAVFRRQLETLRRLEEAPGLEQAFGEQMGLYRQRVRELTCEHTRLERHLQEAQRTLDDFTDKYQSECEHQQQLRSTLEQLNKDADDALLRNLGQQIQAQFLQDDINSTRDRQKKDLAEIQTYVSVLNQINKSCLQLPSISVGTAGDEERLLAQRRIPTLRSQLEEQKSAICQLQAQKHQLQSETSVLELAIKTTQDSYDDEIQRYNEQIETLRKDIEEAEHLLEGYTDRSRQLASYQSSLGSELERYKRIIESEDTRLNSAIIGTPITLLTTEYRYTPPPSPTSRHRDVTQSVQDIAGLKPRHKLQGRKVQKRKELTTKDVTDGGMEHGDEDGQEPQDVPDGTQISKALDTLCNLVRDRMHRHTRPEPLPDFHTHARYVLVSGDSSYYCPCFCSSSSPGHVLVTFCDGPMYRSDRPGPIPPQPGNKHRCKAEGQGAGPKPSPSHQPSEPSRQGKAGESVSYEKVEVVESVEKLSGDSGRTDYEETATIVETTIEKTSKKKKPV